MNLFRNGDERLRAEKFAEQKLATVHVQLSVAAGEGHRLRCTALGSGR